MKIDIQFLKNLKRKKEEHKFNKKLVTIKVIDKETHQKTNYYVKYQETTKKFWTDWRNNDDTTSIVKTRTKTKTFTDKGKWNVFIEKCKKNSNLSIKEVWNDEKSESPTNHADRDSYFCKSQGMILTLHFDSYVWSGLKEVDEEFNNKLIKKMYKICEHGYESIGIPNQYTIRERLSKHIKIDKILDKHLVKLKEDYDILQNIKYAWKQMKKVVSNFPSNEVLKNFDKLRPYQISAYNILRKYNSFALFWESKTGKKAGVITGTIIHKKIMISVPSGQENKWVQEYSKWTHRKDIVVLTGDTIDERKKVYEQFNNAESQILIVASSTLAKDITVVDDHTTKIIKGIWMPNNFDMFIVDDASFLRYSKPRNTLAHFVLRDFSKHAIVLSNSFFNIKERETNDIYGMLKFIKPNYKITKNMMNIFFFEGEPNNSYEWYEFEHLRENKKNLWVEFIETYTFPLELKEVNKWIASEKIKIKKNVVT